MGLGRREEDGEADETNYRSANETAYDYGPDAQPVRIGIPSWHCAISERTGLPRRSLMRPSHSVKMPNVTRIPA